MIDQELTPGAIIALLEEPIGDDPMEVEEPLDQEVDNAAFVRASRSWLLEERAPAQALTEALEQASSPLTRRTLCVLLGNRGIRSAVPVLSSVLDDPDEGVRYAAADALAKIVGYGRRPAPTKLRAQVAEAALRRWPEEPAPYVRSGLVIALSLSGRPEAVQRVREALDDPDENVREEARYMLEKTQQVGAE